MITINYNNFDAFSGLAPLPFVGREESPIFYSNRWCVVDRITLEGQITGQCLNFEQIVERQNELIRRFSKSFQRFEIIEDSGIVYESPVSKVISVNFPSNKYSEVIPFNIELECYLSGLHSGFYGVVEPVDKFEFEKDEEGVVSLVHTCSAKGINTSNGASNSLENAKTYVHSISGWDEQIMPLFIEEPGENLVLYSVTETANRFEGSYSVQEKYRYDSLEDVFRILRYTVDLNSGENGISTDIKGTLEGGLNVTMPNLRSQFLAQNFHAKAGEAYSGFFDGELNENPLSYTINEDSFKRVIDFSFSYDDDEYPDYYYIDKTTISTNKAGVSSISLNLTFKTRLNCHCSGLTEEVYTILDNEGNEILSNDEDFILYQSGDSSIGSRWSVLRAYADSFDTRAFCQDKWEQYGKTTILRQEPSRISRNENKNECEITINTEFRELIGSEITGLDYFEYVLDVSPAIPIYSKTPVICEGEYSITNLGYDRRAVYSIRGEAKISECTDYDTALNALKSEINRLRSVYVTGDRIVLTQSDFTESQENRRIISFSCSWSLEEDRTLSIDYED